MGERRWTRLVLGALLAGALLATTAAAATARTDSTARQAAETLIVWDSEGGAGGSLDTLNAMFEAKFGVKIERVRYGFGALRDTLRLSLSGQNTPDAVQLAGVGALGSTLVKANLLQNLDAYAAKYGWRTRFSPSILAWASFTNDALRGEGSIYGIGQKAEFVGVFYSKSRLARLGVGKPKTLAGFEKALALSKAAGDSAPLLVANAEGWPGSHVFQSILNVAAGTKWKNISKFGYSRSGPSIEPFLVRAGIVLERWGKRGYLGSSPSSVSYNDAVNKFAAGSSVFFITGTWLSSALVAKMGSDLGIMLLPPLGKGGPAVATGSESTPWGIPANAKNKDLAAKYLDFITGPIASDILTKNGDVPALASKTVKPKPGSIQADQVAMYTALAKQDGLIAYFDSATPTLASLIYPGIQELMAGRKGPIGFAREIQRNFDDFIKAR